jgi:hypothetical protein
MRLTGLRAAPKPASVNERSRELRALTLLAAIALGNAGMLALAFPAEAAPSCHEQPSGPALQGDSRCQWASPTSCCDALAAAQAPATLDLPALAPGFATVPPVTTALYLHAYTDPEERVPLPQSSAILRI